jgi:ABC-type nitrate/sulfonate/bicarbonate transport system permease component
MTWLRAVAVPFLFFTLWELSARFGLIPQEALSRPQLFLSALYLALVDGSAFVAAAQTLLTTFAGLAVATLAGVLLGVLLGSKPAVQRVVSPSLEALRPIPSVALIPLALLLFGFGLSLEIAVIAFACVWPVMILTVDAVKGIHPRFFQVADGLELSQAQRLRKIILPAAIGQIWVGVRVAAGIALIVAVTVEIVVNPRGLGYAMIFAQQMFQVDLVYAYLVWTCLIGWTLNWITGQVDRHWLAKYQMSST